jgi:fumarylacetoacetase
VTDRPLDATQDPSRRSWVASANLPEADFPVQNLPLGAFRRSSADSGRLGVAIGDQVLDLSAAVEAGCLKLSGDLADALMRPRLNALLGLPVDQRRELRPALADLLVAGSRLAGDRKTQARVLCAAAEVDMLLPVEIGDYTDFYASIHHATNVGSMFRPDQPLLPNYKWVPIGYHGRASSVVVSGTPVLRPQGQIRPPEAVAPRFGPTRQLDYELELGAWIAGGNPLGTPIPIAAAEGHLFGVSLLNDWSARDLQSWEYQPLGPFLAKNFATTVSPWVVTLEALAPFRVPAASRPEGDPAPLPHLDSGANRNAGGLSLVLEVTLQSAAMRDRQLVPMRLSRTDFRTMYWTLAQLVTHHASNGCNLRPGDLLGSGTVSGPGPTERGCLLELTWRGQQPLTLPSGEQRTFLEAGDCLVLRGWGEAPGRPRIGLGECRGTVVDRS